MMYGIIAIFIIVIFAIIIGTMSYFKAFKVNSRIVSSLEKYEGYNELAREEIRNTLGLLGYRRIDRMTCPQREDGRLLEQDPNFTYCVYLICDEIDPYKYRYGVMTFITVDFPVLHSMIKVPVYTETNSIHEMDWDCNYD